MSARTRVGQRVEGYLRDNPSVSSPTEIARACGCTRQTARQYRDQVRAKNGRPQQEAPPAKVATPPSQDARLESPPPPGGAPGQSGHDITRVYGDKTGQERQRVNAGKVTKVTTTTKKRRAKRPPPDDAGVEDQGDEEDHEYEW